MSGSRHGPGPLGADSRLGRLAQRATTTPLFVRFGTRIVPRVDRAVYRLTGGRLLLSQILLPVLLLTTTGPGDVRTPDVPLATLPEPDGSFLVVGSNWGRPSHPVWSTRLIGRPDAVIHVGGRRRAVTAHLLEGPERDAVWPRLLALWPAYEAYTRSSGRELRVFRLSPRAAAGDAREPGAAATAPGQPPAASRPAAAADTRPDP